MRKMMENLHEVYREYEESYVLMNSIAITQGIFSYYIVTGSFVNIIRKILICISLAGSKK
jgi:hypothetical protein